MVQINKVEANHDYVMVEYETNGITISTRVYHHDELTPQEIIAKGYEELKPHIQMECDRLGIVADHTLPTVEDEVTSIELLGIETINFTEGQEPIEKIFRCAGRTLYGKSLNLTNEAIFNPQNPIVINPTSAETVVVTVTYENFSDTKSFEVTYKSKAEIELEAEEAKKRAEEEEKRRICEEKKTRMSAIKVELSEMDYKTIKYVEGELTEDEFIIHKANKLALRNEYNTLETEILTCN